MYMTLHFHFEISCLFPISRTFLFFLHIHLINIRNVTMLFICLFVFVILVSQDIEIKEKGQLIRSVFGKVDKSVKQYG